MSRLISGVGFNSVGKYKTHINGIKTKSFIAWVNMIYRCYSQKIQERYPTYIGCSVVDEWLDYQIFADWYEAQRHSSLDYHLDKDILVANNKIYSSETCCLVPKELNAILLDHGRKRGKCPQGVYLFKQNGKFVAKLRINGKRKHLGYYVCPNEAHSAYVSAKEQYVKEKALEWKDRIESRVYDALMNWTVSA